jgi:hypothetical protein
LSQAYCLYEEGIWQERNISSCITRANGRFHSMESITGPYDAQKAAIKVAVETAHTSGKNGHDAQVLVQGTDSKFRTEWTYGNDPYPPKG